MTGCGCSSFFRPIICVDYCPNAARTLVLVACEDAMVKVVNVGCGDNQAISSTNDYFSSLEFEHISVKRNNGVTWTKREDGNSMSLELAMPEVSFVCYCMKQTISFVSLEGSKRCLAQEGRLLRYCRSWGVHSLRSHPSSFSWIYTGTSLHWLILVYFCIALRLEAVRKEQGEGVEYPVPSQQAMVLCLYTGVRQVVRSGQMRVQAQVQHW